MLKNTINIELMGYQSSNKLNTTYFWRVLLTYWLY